ncbi:MAG: hypothetical protein HGN29_16420 [Asgard group archaeon]|nr:hypothetical protein [Asgard group archaeon]
MLCYLLGDVVRIFSGNFPPGEIDGEPVGTMMWFGIAAIMVIPIIMVVLLVILKHPVLSWLNVIIALAFLVFNLAGIAGYEVFDIFLLSVSFVFNLLIIYIGSTKLIKDLKLKKSMKS